MVNASSAQRVWGNPLSDWSPLSACWEAGAPDGSNVQNMGCPKAAGSVAGWETFSLLSPKVRFYFIPTLHLERKPKPVICFISQIATFSDVH